MTETSPSEIAVPGESPASPALSQVERVVDTFVAPSKTFTDILRNQSWWLPLVLSAVISYGYFFAVQKQVGWDVVVQNTLKQDPKATERLANASPEARAQAQTLTLGIIKGVFYAAPVLVLILAAIASLFLWGTINFIFAGRATYGGVFAVWMYGTLPLLIVSILAVITLFAGLDKESFSLNNPVGTNLGFYLPADSPKWESSLGESLDIFRLWAWFLVGMGLAIVARVKRSAGLTVIFGWWLLILIVKVAYAAFTG